jgi:poly-gamma-glutamate capsule biosynthesis protein CapA/YwtB (metallophosphatase superfamily)
MMNTPRRSTQPARFALRSVLGKLGGVLIFLAFALAITASPIGPFHATRNEPKGPSPSVRIRLALLGDVMLGRGVAAKLNELQNNPLALLADDLQAADLAFANLESPLTARSLLDPRGYDLRAEPVRAFDLAASGLDVLSLANNHSLDSGPAGQEDTRQALAQAGLKGLASGDPPLRLVVDGIPISVLAYEDVTRPLDPQAIEAAIRLEKKQGAVVIVSLHWGAEFRPAPEPSQKELAQALAQAGADLIWGHHPHVLQPVAWIPRLEPAPPALVVYSLGNALFDQEAPPDARWGAMLLVEIDATGVISLEARPFTINLRQGGIQAPGSELSSAILERLQLP